MKPDRAAKRPIVTAADWEKMTRQERLDFFQIPDTHPDDARLEGLLRMTRALAREDTIREVRARIEVVAQDHDVKLEQAQAEILRRFARVHL